jgi:uncharacterized protein (TIGR00730 family)
MKVVSVFCASSPGNDPKYMEEAYELGRFLASKDITLVYGGAKVGLMGAVADGAINQGGKVIGVIPDFLKNKEIAHNNLTELHIVDSMHTRKNMMHRLSDGVIALPGGYGTLEELFEILAWAQLGHHSQPIGLLNVNGFYDHLLAFLDKAVTTNLLRRVNYDFLLSSDKIDELYSKMISYAPSQFIAKWIGAKE